MVESYVKDIFNVGFIMLIAGLIAVIIQINSPSTIRAYDVATSIAGFLIMIYASMKFYKEGKDAPMI